MNISLFLPEKKFVEVVKIILLKRVDFFLFLSIKWSFNKFEFLTLNRFFR